MREEVSWRQSSDGGAAWPGKDDVGEGKGAPMPVKDNGEGFSATTGVVELFLAKTREHGKVPSGGSWLRVAEICF